MSQFHVHVFHADVHSKNYSRPATGRAQDREASLVRPLSLTNASAGAGCRVAGARRASLKSAA